jgi:hypothetical protein
VGLIFFDKAKTNYEYNQPVTLYKEQLGTANQESVKV